MKKMAVLILMGVLLIISLNCICMVNALNITVNSPYQGQVFILKYGETGKYIEVNVSTDENATCKVYPGMCSNISAGFFTCLFPYPDDLSIDFTKTHFKEVFFANDQYNEYIDHTVYIECKDESNQSFDNRDYKTFFSFEQEFCIPQMVNVSTEWENISQCNHQNVISQRRYLTAYDNNSCEGAENETVIEYREVPCDYCIPNLENTSWSNWTAITECQTNNSLMQTRNLTEYDSNSCGEIKNKTIAEYRAVGCLHAPLSLSLNSPEKGIYNSKKLILDVSSNFILDEISFIDFSNRRPVCDTLCTDCAHYQKWKIFSEGYHNLTFKGVLNNQTVFNSTSFFIDSRYPQISRVYPRANSFTNGSEFYVKYTEENLKEVSITYNPTIIVKECNKSGKNQECWFNVNLSGYDGQEIAYSINVTDVAGNEKISRGTKIKVDTTAPKINNPGDMLSGIYLKINITEANLKIVEYKDLNDPRARWKTACTRLRDGMCEKRIGLLASPHIQIRVIDKAGNSAYAEIG